MIYLQDTLLLNLSLAHWLVVLSACLSIVGASAYIIDTLQGKAKPNRVSWSMWALAPLIGTFAAISANADFWATVRIFLAGFLPLLVFIASFANTNSYWKISKFDMLCGLLSVLAFVFWIFADSPRVAILLAAIGDGFASFPTIIKAWKYPETETSITYVTSLIGAILIIPSIPIWNIENSAFQIYLISVNAILLCAVFRKRINFFRHK